ncbi:MAG TPA: hypothetical protein VI653_25035 [Steroidobacteraceae bacterium]
MSRLVTVRYGGAAAAAKADEDRTLGRIAKYVPSELLAFYSMYTQGVATLKWESVRPLGELVGAAIGVILTLVYFGRFFPKAPPEARKAHLWISTGAFVVYAYTISAAAAPQYFVPGLALMATALITLVSSVIIPRSTRPPPAAPKS